MKKKKIFITSLLTLGALGIVAISVSAYMCNFQDKAEILSELTGKSTNEIVEERVNEKVEAEKISKEEADTIISNREKSMQNCTGTGFGLKECNYQTNKEMNCNDSGYNKNGLGLGKGLGQKNCINK